MQNEHQRRLKNMVFSNSTGFKVKFTFFDWQAYFAAGKWGAMSLIQLLDEVIAFKRGGLIFRETEYPFTACSVSKWEGEKASRFVLSSAFGVVKAAVNCTVLRSWWWEQRIRPSSRGSAAVFRSAGFAFNVCVDTLHHLRHRLSIPVALWQDWQASTALQCSPAFRSWQNSHLNYLICPICQGEMNTLLLYLLIPVQLLGVAFHPSDVVLW